LEIDEAGKYNDNAKSILDVANTEDVENIYIKADGSLNDGLEIVSHPMTFDYHKNTMPWRKIVKCAVDMGYRSHKTSTCGLHCHVNRKSLGYNTTEQENTIARILYFIEHHWAEILKFSRRTSYQMERWANRYGRKNNPKEFISNVKNKSSSNRYVAVNLQNNDTIEFRMFKGTLKYNTIIATLEFVNAVCDAAVNMTDEEMADLSWNDFVSALNEYTYKELITYLKERNLYINEPVEYEEEE
jgi:hypothetical protein